jgi:hypothetical protein
MSAASNRARGRAGIVAVAGLLVVGLLGLGAQRWAAAREQAEQRATLLADVDAALASAPLDADQLSRLVAKLRSEPDHANDRALGFAEARIEFARGRAERARDLFLERALEPGARAAEQAFGAQLLLRLHDNGAASGKSPSDLLAPAANLAESSYAATRDPEDLLRAWQAAERNGEHERAKAFAATLAADHADSAPARFVALAVAFDPAAGSQPIERALAGLALPPAEGRAMVAFAQLQAGDLAAAAATCDDAVARAPGVAVVRFAAAVTFHACALGCAEGSPDRAAWQKRRDVHIDWLLAEPGVDADRLARVRAMRDVR